jgi:hypothetical protein
VAIGKDEPAGSMPFGIFYNSSLLLDDGRLLILKTMLPPEGADYAELFDPTTKHFEPLGSLGFKGVVSFGLTRVLYGLVE